MSRVLHAKVMLAPKLPPFPGFPANLISRCFIGTETRIAILTTLRLVLQLVGAHLSWFVLTGERR